MSTTIKITELSDIGNGLANSTLVPVVDMSGTPTTERANLNNIANFVLNQGVGANLGNVGDITITGGSANYVLKTDGAGNLSWTAQTGGGNGTPGGSNTQIQFNDAGSFGGNTGFTFNKTTGIFTSPFVAGNGNGLSNIQGANVSGAVSYATTANAVAAANVSGLGNLALLNKDGNASNVLHGDGSWGADQTTYSNSNVVNLLASFGSNTITTTGNIAGGNANITGTVRGNSLYVTSTGTAINASSGNILTNEVTGTKFNFLNGSYTASINAGATANYTLTLPTTAGSNGQVLTTNGSGGLTWTTVSGGSGNTGNVTFNGNVISTSGTNDLLINLNNQDFIANTSNGGAIGLYSGNSQIAINNDTPGIEITSLNVNLVALANGDINLDATATNGVIDIESAGNTTITANGNVWTFDSTGVLSKNDANGLVLAANYSAQIITDFGDNDRTWLFDGSSGELVLPGGNVLIDPTDDNFEVRGAQAVNFEANTVVNIYTDTSNNAYQWQFGDDGNLILPGNTWAVNYANGTQVPIGAAQLGNVTFNDQIVIGTGDEFGGGGLYLAPGPAEIANGQYLQVRGGDQPSHIHFDTGNNNFYDQYFGNDNKYVKLSAGYTGNILIGTDDDNGNLYRWTFDSEGNTTVPGNIKTITTGFSFNANIDGINTSTANVVIVTLTSSPFGGPFSGQVTISDVVGTTEANGTWYFEASEANEFQLFYDEALQYPVDGTGWPAYVSGGLAVAAGYNNLSITGGNVSIINNNGDAWIFDNNGDLTLPSAEGPGSTAGFIQTANAYPTLLAYGSNGHGGPELDWTDSNDPAGSFGNNSVLRHTLYLNDEGFYVGFNENGVANTARPNWNFNPDGSTIFPTLTVTRGDRTGTLTGQTILFGDSTQEAILTTSNGTSDINDSQRLVINPGAGYANTTGEGGDIYLYAGRGGDAGGSGGDIKIRGGLGPVDGAGGYIDITGGEAAGNGAGGYIDILGGQSANSTGGRVRIEGGQGISGAEANITGGTGSAGPGGNVNIQGGVAGNGLAEYGNVNINSGASGWTFDNTGNLTLPANTFAVNYANGTQVNIGGGGGGLPLANGTSNFDIPVADGNAVITVDGGSWTFGTTGSLQLPAISLGSGVDEQTVVQSQRKIIPGFRYSVQIDGTTPTVVYTATDNSITSMKVTMQIQHIGLGMEFFDVSATYTGSDTYYTVSNRVQPPTIADSTVVVDLNGSNAMEITVTINSGAANCWVTYDATEFGIAVD